VETTARARATHTWRTAVGLVLAGSALAWHGCASPVTPPVPPGGGTALAPDYDTFVATVEPVLVRQGCDAGGDCHGGGIRGTFALSPAGSKNLRYDFDQAALQLTAAPIETSPLLTEPLAMSAGGTPHGVKPFATTGDADYQAIHAWIDAAVTP
jgi:hypothetical protein